MFWLQAAFQQHWPLANGKETRLTGELRVGEPTCATHAQLDLNVNHLQMQFENEATDNDSGPNAQSQTIEGTWLFRRISWLLGLLSLKQLRDLWFLTWSRFTTLALHRVIFISLWWFLHKKKKYLLLAWTFCFPNADYTVIPKETVPLKFHLLRGFNVYV